jgi:hypothetical protein
MRGARRFSIFAFGCVPCGSARRWHFEACILQTFQGAPEWRAKPCNNARAVAGADLFSQDQCERWARKTRLIYFRKRPKWLRIGFQRTDAAGSVRKIVTDYVRINTSRFGHPHFRQAPVSTKITGMIRKESGRDRDWKAVVRKLLGKVIDDSEHCIERLLLLFGAGPALIHLERCSRCR